MGQVVLLVVGAAWAAVLLPPLLRSRGQNRPNSSVSDFRDQLSSLQRVSRSVHMRSMGRSLVAGPMERPSPRGPLEGSHRSITLHPTTGKSDTGAHAIVTPQTADPSGRRRGVEPAPRRRSEPARGERSHRQLAVRREGTDALKRRRANVLFVLALASVTTLVLALAIDSTPLLYAFGGVFVVLAGYIFLLGRARQRDLDVREVVEMMPVEPQERPRARPRLDRDARYDPSLPRNREASDRWDAGRPEGERRPPERRQYPSPQRAAEPRSLPADRSGRRVAGRDHPTPAPRNGARARQTRQPREHRLDLA
ncbi:MAG: hypothetical protein M3Q72_07785 [Actinomycetota bacterium]|nr:hypothetical protein [Actinomycetota bacterium]